MRLQQLTHRWLASRPHRARLLHLPLWEKPRPQHELLTRGRTRRSERRTAGNASGGATSSETTASTKRGLERRSVDMLWSQRRPIVIYKRKEQLDRIKYSIEIINVTSGHKQFVASVLVHRATFDKLVSSRLAVRIPRKTICAQLAFDVLESIRIISRLASNSLIHANGSALPDKALLRPSIGENFHDPVEAAFAVEIS